MFGFTLCKTVSEATRNVHLKLVSSISKILVQERLYDLTWFHLHKLKSPIAALSHSMSLPIRTNKPIEIFYKAATQTLVFNKST